MVYENYAYLSLIWILDKPYAKSLASTLSSPCCLILPRRYDTLKNVKTNIPSFRKKTYFLYSLAAPNPLPYTASHTCLSNFLEGVTILTPALTGDAGTDPVGLRKGVAVTALSCTFDSVESEEELSYLFAS